MYEKLLETKSFSLDILYPALLGSPVHLPRVYFGLALGVSWHCLQNIGTNLESRNNKAYNLNTQMYLVYSIV